MMENERWHQQMTLTEGRALGFAEYGDRHGHPVFYFHGFPGSRLEAVVVEEQAARTGVRIIAVDRPGFGISGYQAGRKLTDWPEDVRSLADHLKIKRFSLLGVSGGGPYAMVCAEKLGDRADRLTLVGALGPVHEHRFSEGMRGLDRWVMAVCRFSHHAGRPVMRLAAWFLNRHTEKLFEHLSGSCAPRDRVALKAPAFRRALEMSFREAFRAGGRGCALDLHLLAGPWGFDRERIRVPVSIFHGEADTIVPSGHGRLLASGLKGCRTGFKSGEGHYSIISNHLVEILASAAV